MEVACAAIPNTRWTDEIYLVIVLPVSGTSNCSSTLLDVHQRMIGNIYIAMPHMWL